MPSTAGERAIRESIAQILDEQGSVRGCGLLVGPSHIVTCAHVIALAARGVSANQFGIPTNSISVRLPYVSRKELAATVLTWKPVAEAPPADLVEDISVLQLSERAPTDTIPQGLLLDSHWAGRPYMAHGFPDSSPDGDWADGTFKGGVVRGWVQMLSTDGTELQIDKGFSGTGVWDEQRQAFAGIMVAHKRRGNALKPVSYMIPGRIIKEAWRDLPICLPGTEQNTDHSRMLLDLGNVYPASISSSDADVRLSATNLGSRYVKITELFLTVRGVREIDDTMGRDVANPLADRVLSAHIEPNTTQVQLLESHHILAPGDSDGFKILVSALDGHEYQVAFRIRGRTMQEPTSSFESETPVVTLRFPIHTKDGLRRLARRLREKKREDLD